MCYYYHYYCIVFVSDLYRIIKHNQARVQGGGVFFFFFFAGWVVADTRLWRLKRRRRRMKKPLLLLFQLRVQEGLIREASTGFLPNWSVSTKNPSFFRLLNYSFFSVFKFLQFWQCSRITNFWLFFVYSVHADV